MKALLDNEWIGNLFGLLILPLFFYLFHNYFVTHSIGITFFKSVVLALIIMVITGLIHTGFDLIFFSDIIGKEVAYQMMLDDFYSVFKSKYEQVKLIRLCGRQHIYIYVYIHSFGS
jgi:hypothetical protein